MEIGEMRMRLNKLSDDIERLIGEYETACGVHIAGIGLNRIVVPHGDFEQRSVINVDLRVEL